MISDAKNRCVHVLEYLNLILLVFTAKSEMANLYKINVFEDVPDSFLQYLCHFILP